MARSASPLGVEHYVQGQHDITGKAEVSDHSVLPTMKPMRNLHDTSSIVSSRSTASHDYPLGRHSAKQRLLDCQEQYESLARDLQNTDAAKEAAFWCGLGLGVVIASLPSSPNHLQSPLTPESRSGSSNSLATVSDSGFAPSVEVRTRHGLSLGDPDVENSITNLLGGLAGTFTSDVWNRHDPPHSLFPPDVGEGFDVVLSHFNLSRNQKIEDVITFVAGIASRLLVLLQDQDRIVRSDVASYWELCLRVIVSSSDNGDAHVSNALQGQLIKQTPPTSLREPALSYIIKPASSLDQLHDLTPFPALDPIPRAPYFVPRLQRQTRSRAASLMSHSSLRSFSSVRSLGGLSAKSPATLSLSHDFGFARSSSPTGSFAIESPISAFDSLDSLAQTHQLVPQQKRVLRSGNDRSITAPSSPLRPRAPTLSRSTSRYSAGSLKGKGKENVSQQPQEGLRPGPSNVSVRSGTRFVMTCPPTPSGGRSGPLPKMDPVLAALERSSKFKSKSLCLNCGKKGTNYPCCPRCGETWCSRECRIEANNGGKHVCKRSATMPSA